MSTDVQQLDRDTAFLRDEAKRLREMGGKPQWALAKANRFDEIADRLVVRRRELQMTGMNGKPIT